MKTRVLAFGTRMPSWVEEASKEYLKRLPAAYKPELIELAAAKGSGKTTAQLVADEDKRMLASIRDKDFVVALDQRGKPWSTEQLAERVQQWQLQAADLVFLIGGPDGLGPQCLARAQQHWSLSALTLPHPMVRVVLIEQLYRAWSILHNHPYHK